jgi:hypothetical protein
MTKLVGRQFIGTLVLKENVPTIRIKNPADEIEQRRFSRSVRTHDAEDLALFNGQTDIFDRSDAAEGLGSFPYSQQGHG